MAANTRSAARAGTQAAPALLNTYVGDPLQPDADGKVGPGITGQKAAAEITGDGGSYNYGGKNRPNDVN